MRLAGNHVRENDCHTLIDMLLRIGRADYLDAVAVIEGLALDAKIIALNAAQRTAILGVLDDPPDGLAELRGVLAKDHHARRLGG